MNLKYGIALIVLSGLVHPLMMRSTFAVPVEVAKKCGVLSAKAFPPRIPGNPAAGLARGSAREASEYFRKCVESGGNMDESDKQQSPQEKK
jgi:hypothetical protein